MITSYSQETIVAIATPTGHGGVGIVRISGHDTDIIGLAKLIGKIIPKPRHAHWVSFFDSDQTLIDQGLMLYFPAPHSYTGESVLELQGHGGPIVLQLLVNTVLANAKILDIPIRIARAGEFTERAFHNNKIDLAQAEAIADLINAHSEKAARSAARSLSGQFSKKIQSFKEKLVHLRSFIEATLDFPEEEIEFIQTAKISEGLHILESELTQALQASQSGKILRNGIHVVIAGEPNVGKSSLMNALAEEDVAIVTDIPGTTRDKVTEHIRMNGLTLHITDTAGIRETTDVVENFGILKTWQAIENADILLVIQSINPIKQGVLTATQEDSCGLIEKIKERLPKHAKLLNVINKIDLCSSEELTILQNETTSSINHYISVKKGIGIDTLKNAIMVAAGFNNTEDVVLARDRHIVALQVALQHVVSANQYLNSQQIELIAEELRMAQKSLSEITGEFLADDLLGHIFSQFCIGK